MTLARHRDAQTVDFAIVGSGAAGGVIARELARNGLDVVLFEQGPRLQPSQMHHDELSHWFLSGITNDTQRNPQTFRSDPTQTAVFRPRPRNPLWYARTVGGSSVHFTANYWRFREIDFEEHSRLGGVAGTGLADWPIRYADPEP